MIYIIPRGILPLMERGMLGATSITGGISLLFALRAIESGVALAN